jgi:hypothetical protein
MKLLKLASLLAPALLLLIGCDDSVNPYAPFVPKITVFAILNTSTTTQVVRAYSSFDPTLDPNGGTAPDTLLNDAVITLSGQNTLYALRDTTIFRSDLTNYGGDVAAKVASFTPAFGKSYTLTVQSGSKGTVTATTTVPPKAIISIPFLFSLSNPLAYDVTNLGIKVQTFSKGYVLRMLLEYEVLINGIWFPYEDEIPKSFVVQPDGSSFPSYAALDLSGEKLLALSWPLKTLATTIRSAVRQNSLNHMTFKRVVIEVRQYEEHLYNYYQIVRGFRDARTIRTDAPDYTNVEGGLGVFGAFTVERIVFDLPPDFVLNR